MGQSAPYCVWEELTEMERSGEINLCSHTYGLHRFNNDGRTGASMKEGETAEEYAAVVKADYDLCVSCIGGWTGTAPTTMAYPYSRRSSESDALLLANTGYQILMGGANARGTAANYFVDGADAASQLRIMSRPCRMEGTPISEYLAAADAEDAANGVNAAEDTRSLTAEECAEIARWYSPYDDVGGTRWFAGAVYYAYVNGLLRGTSNRTFSPDDMLSRGMVATLMHRMAGEPQAGTAGLSDVESGRVVCRGGRLVRFRGRHERGGRGIPARPPRHARGTAAGALQRDGNTRRRHLRLRRGRLPGHGRRRSRGGGGRALGGRPGHRAGRHGGPPVPKDMLTRAHAHCP